MTQLSSHVQVLAHVSKIWQTGLATGWVATGRQETHMAQLGPDALVRTAYIAQQHFIEGKTRIEISAETGLRRFKIGRILEQAIATGVVRFEIASPSSLDLELSVQLQKA